MVKVVCSMVLPWARERTGHAHLARQSMPLTYPKLSSFPLTVTVIARENRS